MAPAKLASMGAPFVPRENTWNRGTIQTGAINALQIKLHLAWARPDRMRLHVRFVQVGLKAVLLTMLWYVRLVLRENTPSLEWLVRAAGKERT